MTPMTRSTTRRAILVGIVVVVTVLSGAPSWSGTSRISAAGSPGAWTWEPSVRRIARGDRIVWRNPTGATHRVTAYGGKWSKDAPIYPGETTRKRFRRRGLYKFRCTVGEGSPAAHSTLNADGICSGMCGRVRVRR